MKPPGAGYPPSSFPPANEGATPPDLIAPGYMNGAPQVSGPGRGGPAQARPPMPPPNKYPPTPNQPVSISDITPLSLLNLLKDA